MFARRDDGGAAPASQQRRTRTGLHRRPWLTGAVFAVTAAGGVAQQLVPGLLTALERRPAGLHGQWWRSITALVVQDGGIIGLASNLFFLAAVGVVSEQVLSRPRWLLHYLGTGVLAEFVGYAWQPVGGGNSIAICGLVSAVAFTVWRSRTHLAPWGASVMALWCGVLLGAVSTPLMVVGVAGATIVGRTARTGRGTGGPLLLGVLTAAAVLTAARNLHGAALLIGSGLALTGGVRRARTDPAAPTDARARER